MERNSEFKWETQSEFGVSIGVYACWETSLSLFCTLSFYDGIGGGWRGPTPPSSMNLLSWNCQGLGNPWTVKALRGLIRSEDPKIVFLSETRSSLVAMEKIRNKLGFRQSIVEVDIRALYFSPHHIDVKVQVLGVHGKWWLTGFYGHPVTSERYKSWELLGKLGLASSLPWVCLGDFNEILVAHEKLCGAVRNERQMQNFRQAIDSCGLKDLGYTGLKFTWWRNGPEDIRMHLDRGLVWVCTVGLIGSDYSVGGVIGSSILCPNGGRSQEANSALGRSQGANSALGRSQGAKVGDSNSKFFHQKASSRHRKSALSGLYDSEGCNTFEPLGALVADRVTPEMNKILLSEFTTNEVKHALFQMHPSKAPGLDGMSPFFFQKYWDVVGGEVTSAVLDFLWTGRLLPKLNFTHVSLIPKVKDPTNMTQLRLINLCNVIYKISAKVLASRLKLILNDVIGVHQSAFVPGRMISDNLIVAFEVLHHMHNRTSGKLGFQALKLDMSKAYDKVEWGFLETIMNSMGFAPRWVQLVMTYVTTVTYSFLVNGSPVGFISPQRGLCQGDPLSSYLFLLCVEVFSGLIMQVEQQGFLHGIAISRGAPSISHLLFADDSFLFIRAMPEVCQHLSYIFQSYERASG
ncbi:unnamed protein product [Prunus armeniaca]|uniref:Uncharacterized protein n=1 Tax=Prunus armeniaca TaxID=36596 RepID=A0A6J5XG03_PRUAR|nr:unnamed protein product [Prunus armeniaca]